MKSERLGISVILTTDRYETIQTVIHCLRSQTVVGHVELVLVG